MEAARLIGRRFVQLAVVLLLVSFFTFSLVRLLPGDPPTRSSRSAPTSSRRSSAKDLGLDKPFLQQYVNYLGIPS